MACEEGDLNFGRHSPLAIAAWDLGRKKPYVHFDLSVIPAGAEIIEAFVELNHNAQNEDGRSDDLKIPAGRPGAAWNAMTLTWNNSADRGATGGSHCVKLKSRAWSSTGNLAADIQGQREFDLFLTWNYPAVTPPIEKGFASNKRHRPAPERSRHRAPARRAGGAAWRRNGVEPGGAQFPGQSGPGAAAATGADCDRRIHHHHGWHLAAGLAGVARRLWLKARRAEPWRPTNRSS